MIDIRRFADYRQVLTLDAYRQGFRPWAAKSASKVAGWKPRGENSTAVIPDEIFGPLLAAALFLAQVAGPDVIAARAEWRGIQQTPVQKRGSTNASPATSPTSAGPLNRSPNCTPGTLSTSGPGEHWTRPIRCT